MPSYPLMAYMEVANQIYEVCDLEARSLHVRRHYTAVWDMVNAQMTRANDAASITTTTTNFKHSGSVNNSYDNPFDGIYPWSGRRLCNIDVPTYRALASGADITDCVVAWEHDANFSYTHEYGVWVYTPPFYGKSWISGGKRYFDICPDEIEDYIYYPPQITGRWLGRDVELTIDGASKHCLLPTTGVPAANIAGSTMHTYAKNYGASLTDIYSLDATSMLYVVEYANMNIQNSIGNGISDLYDEAELHPSADATDSTTITFSGLSAAQLADFIVGAIIDLGTSKGGMQTAKTQITEVSTSSGTTTVTLADAVTVTTSTFASIHGGTNVADEGIGSMSGYIGTNGKANAYYRGETIYANKFRYVLGAYRYTGDGAIWICDREHTDDYDALDTTVHTNTGLLLPTASNYIKSLGMADGLGIPWFCTEVSGNSNNPVGDYVYVPSLATGNTVLWFGGDAYDGGYCGFYGGWGAAASNSHWNRGSSPRLKNP